MGLEAKHERVHVSIIITAQFQSDYQSRGILDSYFSLVAEINIINQSAAVIYPMPITFG